MIITLRQTSRCLVTLYKTKMTDVTSSEAGVKMSTYFKYFYEMWQSAI